MYKFFRDNQKRLLAFFGVILMIAFVMPSTMKNPNDSNNNYTKGMIGLDKVSLQQTQQAEDEFKYLSQTVLARIQATGQAQWTPITSVLLPPALASEMQRTPEAYFLLQYEARKMGMVPQYRDADDMLSNENVGIATSTGAVVSMSNLNDNSVRDHAREALANLLMVTSAFRRVVDSVKVSDPMIQNQIAQQMQQIKVRVVDFAAKDYESKVPAPTEEQLKKHFDTYAEFVQGTPPSEKDPYGFGYKYPNRIKIQYLAIPRAEVRKAVQASQSEYEWEVRANRYYIERQKEFIATSAPSTQESLSLGMVAAPPTSTTKPFADVRNEVLNRIIEPLVDSLQMRIQNDLTAQLSQDYEAWLKTHPNGPSTEPATQQALVPTTAAATSMPATVAAPYESYEYLQKLAAEMLRRHKVTLTIGSATDSFKDAIDLQALPGIGEIMFQSSQQTFSFAQYALSVAEPFVPADQRDKPIVLSAYEPSRVMQDDLRNGYFFRITATDASRKPASYTEMKDRVETDWKRVQAFELAKLDAQKLLEAAKTEEIAIAAGERKVVQTGEYSMRAGAIENYPVTTASMPTFVKQTYLMIEPLLSKKTDRPVTLIELPADGKVAVAELVLIDSTINDELKQFARDLFGRQIQEEYQSVLANAWFNYDALVDRLHYDDLTGTKRKTPEPATN